MRKSCVILLIILFAVANISFASEDLYGNDDNYSEESQPESKKVTKKKKGSGKLVFANPEMQKKSEEARKAKKIAAKSGRKEESYSDVIVYFKDGRICYCKNVKYGASLIELEDIIKVIGIEIEQEKTLKSIYVPPESIDYILHYKK